MNLGYLSSYRLPRAITTVYGVDTAQEPADQLGVTKEPTEALGEKADSAYQALKSGDHAPARALLIDDLGVSEGSADTALARLPRL
ncbi:hypothetical protein [Subtercola sp. RTI3]|uniref:hypothetical protein n=1 Tax=Subtercola sp. RTI3 TaxID=3048639 RepID=UPI002B22872E|nr:hypothetical protein [Subtercola sp. RTI3]MEA9983826.1 hypothetical protein [Subtercola sp. RTI3]